jgi:hypothetical protein
VAGAIFLATTGRYRVDPTTHDGERDYEDHQKENPPISNSEVQPPQRSAKPPRMGARIVCAGRLGVAPKHGAA